MATENQLLIYKAIVDIEDKPFRNKDIVRITGINAQNVKYHLEQWEKQGFVARSATNSAIWNKEDMPGLTDMFLTSDAKEKRHAQAVTPISEVRLKYLINIIDYYVALKNLEGLSNNSLHKLKEYLQGILKEAIMQLNNEMLYLNSKRMTSKAAAYKVRNVDFEPLLKELVGKNFDEQVQQRVVEILGDKVLKKTDVRSDLEKMLNVSDDDETNVVPFKKKVKTWKDVVIMEGYVKELEGNLVYVVDEDTRIRVCPKHYKRLNTHLTCDGCSDEPEHDEDYPYNTYLSDYVLNDEKLKKKIKKERWWILQWDDEKDIVTNK